MSRFMYCAAMLSAALLSACVFQDGPEVPVFALDSTDMASGSDSDESDATIVDVGAVDMTPGMDMSSADMSSDDLGPGLDASTCEDECQSEGFIACSVDFRGQYLTCRLEQDGCLNRVRVTCEEGFVCQRSERGCVCDPELACDTVGAGRCADNGDFEVCTPVNGTCFHWKVTACDGTCVDDLCQN